MQNSGGGIRLERKIGYQVTKHLECKVKHNPHLVEVEGLNKIFFFFDCI